MSSLPTPYTRQASFTGYHVPERPTLGQDLEAEFNAVKQSQDQTQARLSEIQRDDGKLRNLSVHPDALSQAVRALLAMQSGEIKGLWVTGLVYDKGDVVEAPDGITYIAVFDHVAGASFPVDQIAGKWIVIDSGLALDTQLRDDIVDGTIEGPLRADLASVLSAKGASLLGVRNTLAGSKQQSLFDWLNGTESDFHTDQPLGANVWRLNDRVQIGGLKDYGAAWNGGVGSATGATPEALTLHNWAMRDAMVMADSTVGAITIMGHAQSSKGANWAGSPGNTPSSIGLAGFAINDATNGQGWGVYGEAVRFPGANFTVGSEFAVANLGSVTTPTPSNLKLGGASGGTAAWLQAGAGLDAVGYAGVYGAAANPAAAIAVVSSYADNSIKFRKGFVFSDGALDQATGSTGANGVAMELPRNAEVRWLFNDGSDHVGGSIRASNATAANETRIDFSDFGLRVLGISGAGVERTAFQVVPNPNAVNYLSTYPQAAGQSPQIGPEGSDTNIDFLVAPKGGGLFATSYGATNAVNTANFVAQRTIAMKFNGVTLFLPAMTTGW